MIFHFTQSDQIPATVVRIDRSLKVEGEKYLYDIALCEQSTKFRSSSLLKDIQESSIEFRKGCHVFIRKESKSYSTTSPIEGIVVSCNRFVMNGLGQITSMYAVEVNNNTRDILVVGKNNIKCIKQNKEGGQSHYKYNKNLEFSKSSLPNMSDKPLPALSEDEAYYLRVQINGDIIKEGEFEAELRRWKLNMQTVKYLNYETGNQAILQFRTIDDITNAFNKLHQSKSLSNQIIWAYYVKNEDHQQDSSTVVHLSRKKKLNRNGFDFSVNCDVSLKNISSLVLPKWILFDVNAFIQKVFFSAFIKKWRELNVHIAHVEDPEQLIIQSSVASLRNNAIAELKTILLGTMKTKLSKRLLQQFWGKNVLEGSLPEREFIIVPQFGSMNHAKTLNKILNSNTLCIERFLNENNCNLFVDDSRCQIAQVLGHSKESVKYVAFHLRDHFKQICSNIVKVNYDFQDKCGVTNIQNDISNDNCEKPISKVAMKVLSQVRNTEDMSASKSLHNYCDKRKTKISSPSYVEKLPNSPKKKRSASIPSRVDSKSNKPCQSEKNVMNVLKSLADHQRSRSMGRLPKDKETIEKRNEIFKRSKSMASHFDNSSLNLSQPPKLKSIQDTTNGCRKENIRCESERYTSKMVELNVKNTINFSPKECIEQKYKASSTKQISHHVKQGRTNDVEMKMKVKEITFPDFIDTRIALDAVKHKLFLEKLFNLERIHSSRVEVIFDHNRPSIQIWNTSEVAINYVKDVLQNYLLNCILSISKQGKTKLGKAWGCFPLKFALISVLNWISPQFMDRSIRAVLKKFSREESFICKPKCKAYKELIVELKEKECELKLVVKNIKKHIINNLPEDYKFILNESGCFIPKTTR